MFHKVFRKLPNRKGNLSQDEEVAFLLDKGMTPKEILKRFVVPEDSLSKLFCLMATDKIRLN